MKGYRHSFVVLLVACMALGATAQELTFTNGPKIVSVTPKDTGATIGFIAPKETENTPEILEYQVECSIPGDASMGVSVFVLEELDQTADLYGLENGYSYTCTMFARGASSGLLPRAINSPKSNPSPIFTPMESVQATIFVDEPKKEQAPASEKDSSSGKTAEVPPTNPEESSSTSPVLPKAPSIKDTQVTEDGNVKIIFALPAGDESSPITSFIAACQNNGDATVSSQSIVPAGSTSAIIEGLSTPGEYTCSIAASTADGVGASATKIVKVGSPAVVEEEAQDVGAQDGPSQEKSAAIKPFLSTVGAVIFTAIAIILS